MTYLRVQQSSNLLTGHVRTGDGSTPAIPDGEPDILLQTLGHKETDSTVSNAVLIGEQRAIHHQPLT